MNKQEIVYVAIAIPVISYIAIQATKKVAFVVGKVWGWFVKTIAGQTADAIREVVQPSLESLHDDLVESIEQLRNLNSREHVETQIRLRDVEQQLVALETRLAAVEALVNGVSNAVVDGASASLDLSGVDGADGAG